MTPALRLLPAPRVLRRTGTGARPGAGTRVRVRAADPALAAAARERVEVALESRTDPGDAAIELILDPARPLPEQGYTLGVGRDGVQLRAADPQGLVYGAGTLGQILRQCPGPLPGLEIDDAPDFRHRGYMLDISRDRIPTRDSLHALIPLLADLRINELQLYTEHSFAYTGHERVWAGASPITHAEIRELDARCRAYGVELVPNQNSFGHMERWLRHPEYRPLAERPDADPGLAACLAPGDDAIAFMRALYAELLPCLGSRRINIGCDETFELGRGRSLEACRIRGRGRVYLDYVLQLIEGLRAQGYGVQLWADMLLQDPDLLRDLPDPGVVALVWGYDAPVDPSQIPAKTREDLAAAGIDPEMLRGFEPRVRPFAEAGRPFYVCPGTSSWNSLVGRLPNAQANLRDAAESGLAHGAEGFLITDWGDHGHLQPPPVSLPPLVSGAAVAWGLAANADLDLEDALRRHAMPGLAEPVVPTLLRLGESDHLLEVRSMNASAPFLALIRPPDADLRLWGRLRKDRVEALIAELEDCIGALAGDGLVERELRQAARLARHGAWRLGRSLPGVTPDRDALRADLAEGIAEQERVWLERSRPGGLEDSLARLRRRLADYD